MWSWEWWQREDTMAQRLHLRVQKGVKQGEKTGNNTGKCVGSLGRMAQEVGDLVIGACWEMSAGSRLEQTPQKWFCWDKCSNFALTLGNPGSSTVLGVNEKQKQELPEKCKGGEPEPCAETAGSIQLLKGRRQTLYMLGGKWPLPLSCSPQLTNRAMSTTDLRPLTYRISCWSCSCLPRIVHPWQWTSGELGSASTNFFYIYVYLLNWNKILKALKDGWLPMVLSRSAFHSCSCSKFKEHIPGYRFFWHLWIKWRLKSVKRMFNSCI